MEEKEERPLTREANPTTRKEWAREEEASHITRKDLERVTKGSASIAGSKGTRRRSVEDPGGLTRWKQKRRRKR